LSLLYFDWLREWRMSPRQNIQNGTAASIARSRSILQCREVCRPWNPFVSTLMVGVFSLL
jgi:hypothetical protein